MRITQNGNRLVATHVKGPTHNLLEFTSDPVGRQSGTGPAFVLDQPVDGWPFDAVKQAVLQGRADAGCDGTAVSTIRMLGQDTPMVDVYRWMSFKLTKHLQACSINKQEQAAE